VIVISVLLVTSALAVGLSYLYASILFFVAGSFLGIFVLRKMEDQQTIIGSLIGISIFCSHPIVKMFEDPSLWIRFGVGLLFIAYLLTISSRWKYMKTRDS
jgi:hypothetical protein